MKECSDNNFKFGENGRKFSKRVENNMGQAEIACYEQQQTAFEHIVGKEKIAHKEQFLLFPKCFLLNQKVVSPFVNISEIISLWKSLKLAYEVKG